MSYRNKLILSLCMTSLFCISSSLLAGSKTAKPMKQDYVKAKSVQVESKGIFVKKNGKKIPVESLHTDSNGKLRVVYKTKSRKNNLISKGYCEKKGSDGKDHGWYFPDWNPKKGESACGDCKRERREKDDRRGKD